uniref:PlsC domain-containing protein n=1 Tax=Macrostomum lignano TaxID=282301 RepID=A0A1I8H3V8_9PLAT
MLSSSKADAETWDAKSLCLLMLAVAVLIPAAPPFLLLWFIIRLVSIFMPFKLYNYLDEKLYSSYQWTVLFFYEYLAQTKIILYGDSIDDLFKKKERVLYFSNHQSSVDWIITDMLIARQGGIGRSRYLLKNELKYIPYYGYYFYQHGCIFVNRSEFKADQAVRSLISLEANNTNSWVIIFPEGTRINYDKPAVIKKSQEFATSHGLQPLRYHLTPRVKGTYLTLNTLANYFDAVYDITIAYEGFTGGKNVPQLFSWFKRRRTLHIHLRRLPMDLVPRRNQEEVASWLHGVFAEKDRMMSEFNETGRFAGPSKVSRLPLSRLLPATAFILALIGNFWLADFGLRMYLGTMLLGGIVSIVYAMFAD